MSYFFLLVIFSCISNYANLFCRYFLAVYLYSGLTIKLHHDLWVISPIHSTVQWPTGTPPPTPNLCPQAIAVNKNASSFNVTVTDIRVKKKNTLKITLWTLELKLPIQSKVHLIQVHWWSWEWVNALGTTMKYSSSASCVLQMHLPITLNIHSPLVYQHHACF